MAKQRSLGSLTTGALLIGFLVAGCAEAGQEGGVTPDPSSSPSPSSSSAQPIPRLTPTPPPGKADLTEVTMTGVVEYVGVEGGCKGLRVDSNKRYELMGGDPAVLKDGARVTVTGKIRTDVMTICQIGPVLEVISSRAA